MGLVLILTLVLLVVDSPPKFINLPISISYEHSPEDVPDDFLYSGDSRYPIVGVKGIKLHTDNVGQFDPSIILAALFLGVLIWIFHLARAFMRTVRGGEPFNRNNPQRIRLIGLIVMITGPIMTAVQYIYSYRYIHILDYPGAKIEIEPDIHLLSILFGLVLFMIGHVYDTAVKLKEESDLTI